MDDLVVPGAGTPPRRGWCPGSGDGGGVETHGLFYGGLMDLIS